ncbi:peptidyl-Lys metalloendopeptidase [Flagelloscypha sp. PMI_526]|nr:peptidyl-Lys metalloendopeptidase [Flagelloscypha sp. PMI_526]
MRHLTVYLSGPASVNGTQNFTVTATIKNTGHLRLKILNDVRGLLSTLPTDKFDVSKDNSIAEFIGARAKYVPETIINLNDSSLFTILEPGEHKRIRHNLNEAYNFTSSGGGKFTIVPRDISFLIVDEEAKNKEPIPLRATFQATLHTFVWDTYTPFLRPFFQGHETFVGCSADQKTAIMSAADGARILASLTYSYIASTTTGTPRYKTWFGAYDSTRRGTVLSHFKALHRNDFLGFTYDCTCNDDSLYAWVLFADFGYIYLCPIFWDAPFSGTDSKAGTIIHESSHFTKNGETHDNAYGHKDAKALARTDPEAATMNADSTEYFAENTPPLS